MAVGPEAGVEHGGCALNSYRHAGAALLRSMQLDNKTAGGAPAAATRNPMQAPPSGARAGAGASGPTSILSTAPFQAAQSFVAPEVMAAQAVQPSFLSTPPPQDRHRSAFAAQQQQQQPQSQGGGRRPSAGLPLADPSCYFTLGQSMGEPMPPQAGFPSAEGSAPVAALGLLAPALAGAAPSDVQAPASCRDAQGLNALPDCYMVRNTFIEYRPERSESLERFLEERKCRSSPTSRPASRPLSRQVSHGSLKPCFLDMEDPFAIATPTGSALVTPRGPFPAGGRLLNTPAADKLAQQVEMAMAKGASAAQAAPPVLRLSQLISEPDAADTAAAAAARLAKEIRSGSSLAPALGRETSGSVCSTAAPSSSQGSALIMGSCYSGSGAPSAAGSGFVPGTSAGAAEVACGDASRSDLMMSKLGTSEIPSRGSALHAWGACKPCAFVFQDGCANGLDCEFCHLCEPGERKRRKKERRKLAAGWKVPVPQR